MTQQTKYTVQTSKGPVRFHSVGEPIVEVTALPPFAPDGMCPTHSLYPRKCVICALAKSPCDCETHERMTADQAWSTLP